MALTIQAGHYYAGTSSIRLIHSINAEHDAHYTTYDLHNGASSGNGMCSVARMYDWTVREATPEEAGRCHTGDGDRRFMERMIENANVYARSMLQNESFFSDADLKAELKRRRDLRKKGGPR